MEVAFDPDKDATNRRKHHIPLEDAAWLDLQKALTYQDDRFDYGEDRLIAIGPIRGRVHLLVYVVRDGVMRAISLRKANQKETRRYEQAQATHRL
jgi:uncharacterized DUF497 family protein